MSKCLSLPGIQQVWYILSDHLPDDVVYRSVAGIPIYLREQPISITMKDIEASDYETAFTMFKSVLADEFERRYVSQGFDNNRSIEETLSIGWELLRLLPKSELRRIREEYLEKYYDTQD